MSKDFWLRKLGDNPRKRLLIFGNEYTEEITVTETPELPEGMEGVETPELPEGMENMEGVETVQTVTRTENRDCIEITGLKGHGETIVGLNPLEIQSGNLFGGEPLTTKVRNKITCIVRGNSRDGTSINDIAD